MCAFKLKREVKDKTCHILTMRIKDASFCSQRGWLAEYAVMYLESNVFITEGICESHSRTNRKSIYKTGAEAE